MDTATCYYQDLLRARTCALSAPDSPVQAGTSVEVYCFEGYEEDYDDFWPFQKAVPRAEFDAHGRRKDAGAAVATAAVVAASPTGTDRGAQTKLTPAATAPSGGAARRARAVLLARAALPSPTPPSWRRPPRRTCGPPGLAAAPLHSST